jgi:hypothetical protein
MTKNLLCGEKSVKLVSIISCAFCTSTLHEHKLHSLTGIRYEHAHTTAITNDFSSLLGHIFMERAPFISRTEYARTYCMETE